MIDKTCAACHSDRSINYCTYLIKVAVKPKFKPNRYKTVGYLCEDCYSLEVYEAQQIRLSENMKTF